MGCESLNDLGDEFEALETEEEAEIRWNREYMDSIIEEDEESWCWRADE